MTVTVEPKKKHWWVWLLLAGGAVVVMFVAQWQLSATQNGVGTTPSARPQTVTGPAPLGREPTDPLITRNYTTGAESGQHLTRIEERQALYDRLSRQETAALWKDWEEAWRRADVNELPIRITTLGSALRIYPDPNVYWELARRLSDRGLSLAVRLGVIEVMVHAASPEAMNTLLGYLRDSERVAQGPASSEDATVLERARDGISEISHTRISGSRNWDVSAELEAFWRFSTQDTSRRDLSFVASAIGYLGRPEGVETLLESTMTPNVDDPRRQLALHQMARLRANDPVGSLGAALTDPMVDSETQRAVLLGLLSIGSLDAARALESNVAQVRAIAPDLLPRVESMLGKYKK